MEALDFVKKIIRVRKHILKLNVSQKNKAKCHLIIKNIEITTQAYRTIWKDDAWVRFIYRKREDLIYLIPENKRGSYLNELKNLLNEK